MLIDTDRNVQCTEVLIQPWIMKLQQTVAAVYNMKGRVRVRDMPAMTPPSAYVHKNKTLLDSTE